MHGGNLLNSGLGLFLGASYEWAMVCLRPYASIIACVGFVRNDEAQFEHLMYALLLSNMCIHFGAF